MKALCFLWVCMLTFPSNEGKSLSRDQLQSESHILQKRSPDYYYDYGYEDYDYPDPVQQVVYTTQRPTTELPFNGFDKFIDGLKKLQDALENPDYDWGGTTKSSVDSVNDTSSLVTYSSSSELQEIMVLLKILKRLSDEESLTTTKAPENFLEHAEYILGSLFRAFSERFPPEERRQILYTLAPTGNDRPVEEVVNEFSEMFHQVFGDTAVSLPPPDMDSLDGPSMLLNMTLQFMENAKEEYERRLSEAELQTDSSIDGFDRLRDIIRELHSLSDGLPELTTRRRVPVTTRRPATMKPNEETCTPPYIDVAYKVCILPVLDQQLSWHDARQYCRSRSLDLAMDSAVNKGRKYFNNQLGVTGTRESWTLWVGARRSEEEDRWLWNDGFKVPNFIWSKNQPRVYGPDSRPVGTCMAIHGFSEYYAAALPCHHKRRFVCQKL